MVRSMCGTWKQPLNLYQDSIGTFDKDYTESVVAVHSGTALRVRDVIFDGISNNFSATQIAAEVAAGVEAAEAAEAAEVAEAAKAAELASAAATADPFAMGGSPFAAYCTQGVLGTSIDLLSGW